jgi:hypothetical protein
MEYSLEGDAEPYRVRRNDDEAEVNRFAADWITLHLFASIYWLVEKASQLAMAAAAAPSFAARFAPSSADRADSVSHRSFARRYMFL